MEKILINACEEMKMKYLESSFKIIKFTKENYLKMLNGDRYRHCQLNVPTFNYESLKRALQLISYDQHK